MNEPRPVIGVTEVPDNLPKGTTVMRRNCGCHIILGPNEAVSEFACEHGYMVGRDYIS